MRLLQFGRYDLPVDGMSRACQMCGKNAFVLMKEYQGVKIKPRRCLGCVLKFPPKGVINYANEFLRTRPWLAARERYHQWGLVAQTSTTEVWTCLHCKSTLRSPKLGIPSSRGCPSGVTFRHRRTFWAHNRLLGVRCPLCDGRASLLRAPRILEARPSSKFFPWTCHDCFRT